MVNKNQENNLKNTATLTKFGEFIAKFNEVKNQNNYLTDLNVRLREQIALFQETNEALNKENQVLRHELRQEKKRSNEKVELDAFHLQLASIVEKTKSEDIAANDTWKALLDALIVEVENCIQLVLDKKQTVE